MMMSKMNTTPNGGDRMCHSTRLFKQLVKVGILAVLITGTLAESSTEADVEVLSASKQGGSGDLAKLLKDFQHKHASPTASQCQKKQPDVASTSYRKLVYGDPMQDLMWKLRDKQDIEIKKLIKDKPRYGADTREHVDKFLKACDLSERCSEVIYFGYREKKAPERPGWSSEIMMDSDYDELLGQLMRNQRRTGLSQKCNTQAQLAERKVLLEKKKQQFLEHYQLSKAAKKVYDACSGWPFGSKSSEKAHLETELKLLDSSVQKFKESLRNMAENRGKPTFEFKLLCNKMDMVLERLQIQSRWHDEQYGHD